MCNCNTNNCGCNQTNTCAPDPCSCPIFISSDCVNNVTEDLTCSNILKGQTLSEVLVQLDEFICTKFDSVTNFFNLINVGTGSEIYKGVNMLGKKEIRTLLDSGLINLAQGTNDITISVDEAALNTFIEANQKTYSVANTGTGAEIYKSSTIVGDNTQFNLRKIKSSNSSVTVTQGTDDIDLSVAIGDTPPLETIDEGNGDGIAIRGRVVTNYGNIGANAIDLSFSETVSGNLGATGQYSTASGKETTASGFASNSSGTNTTASGLVSHAEGDESVASGYASHAEGATTTASGGSSHSEGFSTTASGISSHAEGERSNAAGDYSHSGGYNTDAIGIYSFASGQENAANSYAEISLGHYGTQPVGTAGSIITTDRLFNVGNGTSALSRTDAITILKNGLATLPSVTNALITAGSAKSIVTKEYLASVNDGSETKVTAGTNISVTGIGTIGSPYVVNSTYVAPTPDGSETKVTAGTNITVTGAGTIASPYVVSTVDLSSITAYLPVNKGTVGGVGNYIDPSGGTVGNTYPVSGNIVSATITDATGGSTTIRVVLSNAMATTNYLVKLYLQSFSTLITDDNDIASPIFKVINTTTFDVNLRQVDARVQAVKLHIEVLNS